MCGIAGILSLHHEPVATERLQKMGAALIHRGPDGEGYWQNRDQTLGFAHRRLAIIDLSEAAGQPMHYLDRYTIVYNGEIYNYPEIRAVLLQKGYRFRTQSDTEVILAAYDCYREACLQHFDGMFAFAIWDEKEQVLFAARDRFGEKPFYYHAGDAAFLFASEMKALWAAGVPREVEHGALLYYLALGWTGSPADPARCFYRDIYSLPPAHFLLLRRAGEDIEIHSYWDLYKEEQVSVSDPGAAIEDFNGLFGTSVERRLRSDVPVGSSLSGGLDSSSVVATMTQLLSRAPDLAAFSAVFPGFEKDESARIGETVDRFGLRSYSVTPAASDLVHDLEKLLYHHETPVASASVYAQYRVFELAQRQGVKVLLDGQGADETLAGYPKYLHWFIQEMLGRRKFGQARQELEALRQKGLPVQWSWKNYLAAFFPAQTAHRLERKMIRQLFHQPDLQNDFREHAYDRLSIVKPLVLSLNDILYFNTCRFGLEELLRNADRNAMAHGREVRLPFLNHKLVEFAFALPSRFKIHDGWTKWILRKAMESRLPGELVWQRGKTGFEPPQKQWMEDPGMQERIRESRRRLVQAGILKPAVLDKKIQPQHSTAADNYDWRYLCAGSLWK